jgi:two-component system, NarL family, nitrate/nitrite response regulator NarL
MAAGADNPSSSSAIPLILADSEAIFRFGLRRLLESENGIEVVAEPESLQQVLEIAAQHKDGVMLFDTRLSLAPVAALSEVLKHSPALKVVMLTAQASEEETVAFLRRGAAGIADRNIRPELLIRCVRKVWAGELWLSNEGINWLLRAYADQSTRPAAPATRVRLNEKEMLIISGVARGMKNREIAIEIGTTEQVVKNYLRKVYDKLGIGDRLELALYCVQHHLLENLAHNQNVVEVQPLPQIKPKAASAAAGSRSILPQYLMATRDEEE